MKNFKKGSLALVLSLAMVFSMIAGIALPERAEAGALSIIDHSYGVSVYDGKIDAIDKGDWVGFSAINFTNVDKITFKYYKGSTSACWVDMHVRLDSTSGREIASKHFSGQQKKYTDTSVSCKGVTGSHKLYLVFDCNHYQWRTGDATPYLRLKGFKTKAASSGASKPAKVSGNLTIKDVGGNYPYRVVCNKVSGATSYQFQFCTNKSFKNSKVISGSNSVNKIYFRGAKYGQRWYVRVRAHNSKGGYGAWSKTATFVYKPKSSSAKG